MSMVSGVEGGLPFQEPDEQIASDPAQFVPELSKDDPVIEVAPEAGSLSAQMESKEPGSAETTSVQAFWEQLKQGAEALKALNFEGFKQVYPVFLVLFGSVVVGIGLIFVVSFLQSMNHLPLIGGVFEGLSELVGLVVVTRFVSGNLLRQQKRAELYARIVVLKKDLLG